MLILLVRDGHLHEVHPDRQRRLGSGFLVSQGLLFVVAHPHAAGNRRRKAHEPGVGEVVGRARLARQRMVQFAGRKAGAVQHHASQQFHHHPRRMCADHVAHVGKVLLHDVPVVIGHLADGMRAQPYAVVGKGRVRRGVLQQGDFGRAQRHRQIGLDLRGDAEFVHVLDHRLDADPLRQLDRRNIARLRQRVAQRDRSLVLAVVVVRRPGSGDAGKTDGRIDDGVIGQRALLHRRRVDVGLER